MGLILHEKIGRICDNLELCDCNEFGDVLCLPFDYVWKFKSFGTLFCVDW